MTTWQDQQPQSRRARRESERANAQATMPDTMDENFAENQLDQQNWQNLEHTSPREQSDQTAQAHPAQEEPLRRPRRAAVESEGTYSPTPDAAAYRLRDFRPDARGSSFSTTPTPPWTPPSPGSGDLNYHTSGDTRRPRRTDPSDSTAKPPIGVTHDEVPNASTPTETRSFDSPIEHTLTRRELRELRRAAEQQDAHPGTPDEAVAEPVKLASLTFDPVIQLPSEPDPGAETVSPMPVAPETVRTEPAVASAADFPRRRDFRTPASTGDELDAAVAEFDTMLPHSPEIPPLEDPPMESRAARRHSVDPEPAMPSVHVAPPPATVAPPPATVTPPPPWAGPESATVAEPESATVAEPEPLHEIVTAPEVYSASDGHWSHQVPEDEELSAFSGPHKRDIAAIDAITTSALILPSFPTSGPITGPVSGSGEILMTGSINLPRSLGVTGLHPSRYDRADIDDIIDAVDREDVSPDSAPVRAVRAVSTYTSSHGIINAKRPKGNNLPMVLSITAGVMMVGVVVLIIAGMIFKIF